MKLCTFYPSPLSLPPNHLLKANSLPPPSPPKPPPNLIIPPLSLPPPRRTPPPHPPKPNWHPRRHKSNHNDRLPGLRKHRPRQQKQRHAAEDNRRADPRPIRSLQVGFPHPQHDQSQHGEEVECIPGYTVKRNQRAELSDDDVNSRQHGVGDHGVDRGETQRAVGVADQADHHLGEV